MKMNKLVTAIMLIVLMFAFGCTGFNLSTLADKGSNKTLQLVLKNNPTYSPAVVEGLKNLRLLLTGEQCPVPGIGDCTTYDNLKLQIAKLFPGQYADVADIIITFIDLDTPYFTQLPMLESYKAGIVKKIDQFIVIASK